MIDVGKLEAAIAASPGEAMEVSTDQMGEITAELKRCYSKIGELQRGATIAEVCAGLATR